MASNDDFMRRAIALAAEGIGAERTDAHRGGGPFGAVIVRDGQIVAEGANRVTSANDPTAHAEIVAIRAACQALGAFSLAGAEIFSSCEPCPMCLAAIYWARLDRLWFANTSQFQSFIGRFVDRLAERLHEMDKALRNENMDDLATLAHWLKGSAGTVGFDLFTQPAAELEYHALSGHMQAARDCLESITEMSRRIVLPQPKKVGTQTR